MQGQMPAQSGPLVSVKRLPRAAPRCAGPLAQLPILLRLGEGTVLGRIFVGFRRGC